MAHSTHRKIWAGALAALLALFAAVVVVATPAEAAPEVPSTGGYIITNYNSGAAPTQNVTANDDNETVTINLSAKEDIEITPATDGTQNNPYQIIISGTGAATSTIYLNGLNVSLEEGPVVNVDTGNTANIAFIDSTTLSVDKGNVVAGASLTTINLTGQGAGASATLTAKGNTGNAISGGTNPTLTIKNGLALQMTSHNSAGVWASEGNFQIGDTTDTTTDNSSVSLTNAGSGPALALTGSGTISIDNGASLTASVTSPANTSTSYIVSSLGAATINGTLNINLSNANKMGGLSTAALSVGTANAVGAVAVTVGGENAGVAVNCASLTITNASSTVSAISGGNSGLVSAGAVQVDSGANLTASGAGKTGVGLQVAADGLTLTKGTINATSAGAAAINVDAGGATFTEGTVNATSEGGDAITVDATSTLGAAGATINATANGKSGNGITCDTYTQSKGSVTASSASGIGLSAATVATVSAGSLTATGEDAGISSTTGGLKVSSIAVATAPVVTATATGKGMSALLVDQNTGVVLTTGADAAAYQWVAVSGTEGETGEDAVLVRGFATAASKNGEFKASSSSKNVPVGLPGAYFQVSPNPIKSLAVSMQPSTNSLPAGDGYMVVNTADTPDSESAGNAYMYTGILVPTFTDEVPAFADGIKYPAATIDESGLTASDSNIVKVGSDNAYLIPNTVKDVMSVAISPATPKTNLSNLYTNPINIANATVPLSYQVTFVANCGGTVVAQPAAPADPAGAFAVTSTNTYFTAPGTGDLVNGIPQIDVEGTPVAGMPELTKLQSVIFLGWYQENVDGNETIYGPEPTTKLGTYTENTTFLAALASLSTTATVLGNSPMTIPAGSTGYFTVPVTLNLKQGSVVNTLGDQDPAIVIDPSAINVSWIVNGTGWASVSNAPANGVTLGEPTMKATTSDTYIVDIPVQATAEATPGSYTAEVGFGKAITLPSGTSNLAGVVTVTKATMVPIVRLYNPYDGQHIMTASQAEIDTLVGYGWIDEDVAWYAPSKGIPVYRLYNPYSHDHYYTTKLNEFNELKTLGWLEDNEGDPVFYGSTLSNIPVYQLFNPYVTTGTHLWTANVEEYDEQEKLGWVGENPVWYAASLPEDVTAE